jgi:hypothetical protein
MMVQAVQELVEEYAKWLKDKTILRQVADTEWVEVTTPYLDRHNDYVQIYVKKQDDGFLLSDGGETVEDLQMSGCSLDGKRRQDLLQMTLNGFGVKMERNALNVRASMQNFPMRKHNLVQAILAVNDLFYLAAPMVASLFLEDVKAWLELSAVRFVPNVKFSGASGYDHHFHFAIPAFENAPERILRVINRPNRETAESMAFAWFDTKDARASQEAMAFAILNDTEQPPMATVLDALRNYDIRPVLWSRREDIRHELAA